MTKIAPRNLRVAEATRLINSTPLGEVIQPHVVTRHLARGGTRISPPQNLGRIDLVRYTAWLFHERFDHPPDGGSGLTGYEAQKESALQRGRALSESARDIGSEGWVHDAVDPQRKDACRTSFRLFCESYFPRTFHLAWSDDHLRVIGKLERAILHGGLFAMAMPRGSGKTTLCETGCLWALAYGHRAFVALIGSDEEHAASMLDAIKTEVGDNDLLEQDFSEVCGPVRALEGIHQRASGQLYRGARTHIAWTNREVILPTIPGSAASGSTVRVAGLTGRIRGMRHKRSDGQTLRPSLVLLDDPQTDESARSPSQCQTREQILAGAILGLAGPGCKIAGLMTLTVVRPDDMADRLLDREQHPAWQGERTKMVYAFPTDEKRWQEYARLRAEGQRNDRGTGEATEYYRENQEAMDKGAKVAWAARKNDDELSAIQHAMNLKLDQGESAFASEYQNEPLSETADEGHDLLSVDAIAGKTTGFKRGRVPGGVTHLTMFVDVQGSLLYWLVCGWQEDFTGFVLDYGAYPDPKRAYFTLRDVKKTIQSVHTGTGQEGAIYAALEALTSQYLAREWLKDDGGAMKVTRCLIDANWGASTDVVYMFCRQSV